VSWGDSQEFVAQLNELNVAPSGFRFSLPTEAQWEYGCRAGSTTAYCFGDNWQQLPVFAWFSGYKDFEEWEKSKEWKDKTYSKWGDTTHPVGTKQANAWGLYDMHGNVWEWCLDWYDDYPSSAVADPSGASSGDDRVYRGGSWRSYAVFCRSACRGFGTPEHSSYALGLRVALVSVR
jgi:formylglycine-generating enzyme required for sulfatase activity